MAGGAHYFRVSRHTVLLESHKKKNVTFTLKNNHERGRVQPIKIDMKMSSQNHRRRQSSPAVIKP